MVFLLGHPSATLAMLGAFRFYADCLAHDEGALECSARLFGQDLLLFGSDWPFSMGTPDAQDALARLPRDIADKLRAAVPK
jgi:aminocarboxymuconate-semialdehyde decarboxylase